MPYLIDTDWVIDALIGRQPAVATLRRLAPDGLAVSLITVGEVYEGAFGLPQPAAHLASFHRFLAAFQILNLSDPIMERFAELRAQLRRSGQLIPDFDLLIGATALHHGLILLTNNRRHFGRLPNLKLH